MRRCVAFLVGCSCLVPAGLAAAGPFGGFSSDGKHYLVDADLVCEVVAGQGAPRCGKRSPDEVARLGFRKGSVQRGAGASVLVQASGTRLTVRSADRKTVRAEWDSGDPVGAVGAVYLSADGKQVAIEYDARRAGRTAPQVVALAVASGAAPPAGEAVPPGATSPANATAPPPAS